MTPDQSGPMTQASGRFFRDHTVDELVDIVMGRRESSSVTEVIPTMRNPPRRRKLSCTICSAGLGVVMQNWALPGFASPLPHRKYLLMLEAI